MRKRTRRMLTGAMLLSTTWSLSCASAPLDSPPRLEARTLRLSPDFPGFEYQYQVCVKQVLFICTQTQMKKETYDLRDEIVRRKLIDMGFALKVREAP